MRFFFLGRISETLTGEEATQQQSLVQLQLLSISRAYSFRSI